jgi:hypothetical protein
MQSMFYMGLERFHRVHKFNDDGSCTLFTGNCDLGRAAGPCTPDRVGSDGIPASMIRSLETPSSATRIPATIPCRRHCLGERGQARGRDANRRILEIAGDLLDVAWMKWSCEMMGSTGSGYGWQRPWRFLGEVCRTAFKRKTDPRLATTGPG